MKSLRRSVCFGMALYSGLIGVADAAPSQEEQDKSFRRQQAVAAAGKTPWKEVNVELPAPPQEGNLRPLLLHRTGSAYRYFIDAAAISVASDKVVRYTVIMVSPAGANSGFFEGLRCATDEFKTYGYLTTNGEIRRRSKPIWKFIRDHSQGAYMYRKLLAQAYLCDQDGFSNQADAIEAALMRYRPGSLWVDQLGADRQNGGDR